MFDAESEARTRFLGGLIRDVFPPDIGDMEALALMAVLHLYRFELREPMMVGNTLLKEVLGVELEEARHAVASIWRGLATERRSYVYWDRQWEEKWRAYGTIDELDGSAIALIESVRRRLETHRSIASLHPDDNRRYADLTDSSLWSSPPRLRSIRWLWYFELKRLPLRALVALATRSAVRSVPCSALWVARYGSIDIVARWLTALSVMEGFAAGRLSGDLSYSEQISLFPDVEQLYPEGLGEAVSVVARTGAELPALLGLTSTGCMVINCAVSATQEAMMYLQCGFPADLDHCVDAVGHSLIPYRPALLDFQKLVDLNLGSYGDLGQPVEVGESGPLGPLWYAESDKPEGYNEGMELVREISQRKSGT